MNIQEELISLKDDKYKSFQSALLPTIDKNTVIGVRVPGLRRLSAQLKKTQEEKTFLSNLPHEYYEENLLHSILLSQFSGFEDCVAAIDEFLPYVDNWAVCDTLNPKIFALHKTELLPKIKKWMSSKEPYTLRFGIKMLMTYYLGDGDDSALLALPSQIHSEEYYVNMMIAWFYAEALAKKWDAAIFYLKEDKLPGAWVRKKTIQKALESYKLSDAEKDFLRKLKK